MSFPTMHIEGCPVLILVQQKPSGNWRATCEVSAFEFEKEPPTTFFSAYGHSSTEAVHGISQLFTRSTRLHWVNLTAIERRARSG